MNKAEKNLVLEALLAARAELEELVRCEDWFVSDSLDLIESALEIVEHEQEQ